MAWIEAYFTWLDQTSVKQTPFAGTGMSADKISALVDIVARRHPAYKATCLPQSLVLWHFLRQAGYPADLRIGVNKQDGGLIGHAWVELDGQVINDIPDVRDRYAQVDLPSSVIAFEL
ncbi:MAG: lasso peptide biosynthesis B2 protein [Chloroflexota bacterium]